MNECEHGSLPDLCGVDGCQNRTYTWEDFDVSDIHPPGTVLARHDGYCRECDEDIIAGVDFIVMDDLLGWVHEGHN